MIKSKPLHKMDIMKRSIKKFGDIIEYIPEEEIDETLSKLAIKS